MSSHRAPMMDALRAVFVPALRARGFEGSFPHLRRRRADRIDFLDVQFNRYGGSFCLNLGQTGADGLHDPSWPDLPVEKTTVGHLRCRGRVHWGFLAQQWFEFGPSSSDAPRPPKPPSHYEAVAGKALKAFAHDGERWFARRRALQS